MKGQEKRYRGRPAKRGHIPFGYRIKNGRAVVNDKEAEQLRQIISGYLSGLSYINAAKEVGLDMGHTSVKNLLQNKRYLGDDFYPAIIDQETFEAVESERLRRLTNSPIKHYKRGTVNVRPVQTEFVIDSITEHFTDPYEQAEYVYSRIMSVDAATVVDLKNERNEIDQQWKGV